MTTSGEEAEMSDTAENEAKSSINWKLIETYESGKSRRYNLLFAVNGGTFAIVSFLLAEVGSSTPFIEVFIPVMCLAFIWFSVCMTEDIKKFGCTMRKLDNREEGKVFGNEGQSLLCQIKFILVLAWVGLLLAGVLRLSD